MDDFRRKDFLFTADLAPDLVTSPALMNHLLTLTRRSTKYMRFLASAL
jgi:uncharacterized protein (DUF2461 family)